MAFKIRDTQMLFLFISQLLCQLHNLHNDDKRREGDYEQYSGSDVLNSVRFCLSYIIRDGK
jgi:hypothetical protein